MPHRVAQPLVLVACSHLDPCVQNGQEVGRDPIISKTTLDSYRILGSGAVPPTTARITSRPHIQSSSTTHAAITHMHLTPSASRHTRTHHIFHASTDTKTVHATRDPLHKALPTPHHIILPAPPSYFMSPAHPVATGTVAITLLIQELKRFC